MKKIMSEADRKNLETFKSQRYRANGMSEAEAMKAARKDVQLMELQESRRTAAVHESDRMEKRKELYMSTGMSATAAEIAARGRMPG